MKFFDLELNGLAAGFAKEGRNGILKDITYIGSGGCTHNKYTNGTDWMTCGTNANPGTEAIEKRKKSAS